MDEVRQARSARKKPFDYDAPVEGLRALDRYTFQIRLTKPNLQLPLLPRRLQRVTGAVAREVVEVYGDKIIGASGGHRAVPARVLEAHPRRWCSRGTPTTARNTTTRSRPRTTRSRRPRSAQLHGRQAADGRSRRGLDHRGAAAALALVPERRDRRHRAAAAASSPTSPMPNGKLAPNLAKRGIYLRPLAAASSSPTRTSTMEDPVVGGYTPGQGRAAPRDRAGVGHRGGDPRSSAQEPGDPAQQPDRPGRGGYDPDFRSSVSDYNPAKAQGAARHVRLRRLRRRRLARPARRPAARPRVRDRARDSDRQLDRALEEEHGRHRRPHRLPERESGPST